MNIQLHQGLPKSHKFIHLKLDHLDLKGIYWAHQDIETNQIRHVYKDWATVHFNSSWYELTAQATTTRPQTLRDLKLLLKLLNQYRCQPQLIIDMHCGSGRHLIELSKLGFNVVGFEGAKLLRQAALLKAKSISHHFNVYSTSKANLKKYTQSADIVTTFFNSLGYTFDFTEDLRRLKSISQLIKPGGYIFIDYRSGEYQLKKYQQPVTEINPIHLSRSKWKGYCETSKVANHQYLAAKEIIRLRHGKSEIVAQTNNLWLDSLFPGSDEANVSFLSYPSGKSDHQLLFRQTEFG